MDLPLVDGSKYGTAGAGLGHGECLFQLFDLDVAPKHLTLRALMNLQGEKAFGIGAVIDPMGRWYAVDPGLHNVPFDFDRQTVPILLFSAARAALCASSQRG